MWSRATSGGGPLKIGVDAAFFGAGPVRGIERFTINLVEALARAGDKVRVTVFVNPENRSFFDKTEGADRLTCRVGPGFRAKKVIWQQVLLPDHVWRLGLDVLLCPGNFLPVALPAPMVPVIHDLIPFAYPESFHPLERHAMRLLFRGTAFRARRIITPTLAVKTELVKRLRVRPGAVRVVPEAVDPAFRRQVPEDETLAVRRKHRLSDTYLLCPASDAVNKNLPPLVRAFGRMHRDLGLTGELVLAGVNPGGPEPAPWVRRIGTVTDMELAALYAGASLVVIPSRYEGFGLPVLEAMAQGAPVLCARVPSLAETGGDAALYFEAGSEDSLSRTLAHALTDPALTQGLSLKGRQRAAGFSWEATAGSVLEVLQEAAAGP